ncbi:MAG: MarR family transcriptional regulator [Streptosporangiales bacterium]|nr:MarR family transcriptional regulator [Streptosporangiales bacterium]
MERSALHAFADEIGLFFEDQGLPRMPGRVLGWLMVCDPPHQSAEELAEAVQASRGAISMAVKLLIGAGAVERHPVAGTRRVYYRLRPGFWLLEAESKARVARDWRKLMERGLDLMDDLGEDRTRRVKEAHDMYAFLEQEYSQIRDRWLRRQEGEEI